MAHLALCAHGANTQTKISIHEVKFLKKLKFTLECFYKSSKINLDDPTSRKFFASFGRNWKADKGGCHKKNLMFKNYFYSCSMVKYIVSLSQRFSFSTLVQSSQKHDGTYKTLCGLNNDPSRKEYVIIRCKSYVILWWYMNVIWQHG